MPWSIADTGRITDECPRTVKGCRGPADTLEVSTMSKLAAAAVAAGGLAAIWWAAVRVLDSADAWAFIDHPELDDDDDGGGATTDELLDTQEQP
jgi:hypothetical protein